MAATVSIRFTADASEATREIQSLRQTQSQLNKTILENRNAQLSATGEDRKRLQTIQAANRVQQAAIQQQIRETTLRKQAVMQLQQEARARERAADQAVRAAQRTRAAQQQAVADLTTGARIVAQNLARLTGGLVQAAANMETFRNSVQAVTRDAAETDRILGQLLDLTVELVGIDTGALISFAGRLMATGLSAEQAITAIRGVTERVAEQGKSAAVTSRVLEQLTQAISSNTISAQDFRPILRELPTLFQDASNALGVNIRSLEDFRTAAEAVGGPVEAIIRLTEEMGRASEGANLDTFNAQIDILQDQASLLAAELGEHLIPAIVSILKQVNIWIEEFRNMDDEAQAAIAWTAAVATGVAALAAVVGTATVAVGAFSASIGALTGTAGLGGVATLAGQAAGGLGRVVSILGRLGSVGNLAATAGITLAQAWNQIYNDFQRTPPFEDAVESIQALNLATSQTAQSLGVTAETFSGVAAESVTEAGNLISRLDELRGSFVRLANSSGDNRAEFAAARAEYRELLPQLEALLANLPQVSTETDAVTESVEEQIEALIAHALQVIETRKNLENLAEGQEILNTLWGVASGQLEDYSASIEIVIPSVTNLTEAQDALNASVQAGIDATNEAVGDPLSDYIDGLDLTSESADSAFGSINQVGEAVRDADFTRAAAELTDFDDAFQLSEATIPKVTSAMREFTGTAPDIEKVERAVEQTTRSVDDLFDEVQQGSEIARDVTDDVLDLGNAFQNLDGAILDLLSGGSFQDAFFDLGEGVAETFINSFEKTLSSNLENAINNALGDGTGAGAGAGGGAAGGLLTGVVSLLTSPVALAAIVPAAVFFATKYIGDQIGETGIIDDPNRQGRPLQDDPLRRRRGESQEAYEARIGISVDVDDDSARTATRGGRARRIGEGAGTPAVASVSEGRQRRGAAGEEPSPTSPFGRSTAQQPTLRALTDVQSAYIQSLGFDPSQYGYDRRRNAFVKTAGGDGPTLLYDDSVAFDEARTPTATVGSELGTPSASTPAQTPDPRTRFSFTADERADLEPYLADVRDAEEAIEDLTEDSTPQEIATAYQNLVFAQTNLKNVSEGIIRAAADVGRITGTAATNAIRTLESDLGGDLRTANNALISSLGEVGFEVIGGIENIREAIDVSDISSVFRRIPAEVEAAAEPEPEPEADPLRSTFRFTGDQRGILAPLVGEVTAAQDFIDNFLTEDSSPEEIRDAYANLTDAETALFNQKVQFILLATGITDEARGRALGVEQQIYDREIREANDDLVDAFEDIGLQLVNALTFTSGILRGTALATQQIPAEVEAAADETETAADDDDTDNPLAGLRSTARLAANQVRRSRTALGQATSESDFETRRVDLIQSINAAYTAQIALLDALGLSEADYQDRFEDAEDARDAALTRATNTVNTFAQARIKGEEDTAKAAQDAADDAIEAAERSARETMQIAERQQRAIDDLRDDALDAERDRADALVDLAQDTQDRILDIERDANRSREDIAQDFLDDNADLRRAFIEDQGDVADAFSRGDFDRQEADRRISDISRGFIENQVGLQRERDRDLRDLDIRTGRREEDVGIRTGRQATEIDETAQDRLTSIQQQTAELESQTAVANAEAAMMTTEATQMLSDASMQSIEAAEAQRMAAIELQSAARVQGLTDAAIALSTTAGELARLPAIIERGLTNVALGASAAVVQGVDATLATIIDRGTPDARAIAAGVEEGMMAGAERAAETEAEFAQPAQAVPTQEIRAGSVSITAATVSVNGGSVSGGDAGGSLLDGGAGSEINATIMLELGDGTVSEIGDQQVRLREQGRSL